ncbi:hypothetical protein SAMN05443635_101467 [Roseobacter denitrificans OCh 114]|nr:hypothetical protein SAMN05443635_101467 [Roseobacter denitrificans OCh 114]
MSRAIRNWLTIPFEPRALEERQASVSLALMGSSSGEANEGRALSLTGL